MTGRSSSSANIVSAAALQALNRRLDAAIAVLEASRDKERLAQLKARAGIEGRPERSVLVVLLYWFLVENPL